MPLVLEPNAAIVANLRRKPTVGDEDIAAAKGHAAGILFVAPDGDVLLLRRGPNEKNFANHWSLPGGNMKEGESPESGAHREAIEEMGPDVPQGRRRLIDQKLTPTGMVFHTFAQPVKERFNPRLNGEHAAWTWAPLNALPSPMHPAVQDTLTKRVGAAADMSPEDWQGMVGGLLKFLAEESQEPEHAQDESGRESAEAALPPDHLLGMKVPKGGSCCGNCGFLATDTTCGNEGFVAWNGSSELPAPKDEYCCDLYAWPKQAEDAEFNESDHPRAPDGKFGSGGGGGSSSKGSEGEKETKHPVAGNFEAPKHADLKAQGFKPKSRAIDTTMHQTALVAWKYAQQTGKDAVAVIGGRGWRLVTPGLAAPFGTPHIIVSPEGKLRFYRAAKIDEDSAITFASDEELALDRESVRTKDIDGRLHVADVPLCRESVDPYKGSEIPGHRKLGLDPEKIYHLWRPADELEKAMPTILGVPLLRKHVPTSAEDHKSKDTIGAVGTNARWEAPFIVGELVVWPAEDIKGIETKEKYNLSPGYRYTPVLEDGDFRGQHYDLVMKDIAFNHVAVVEHGRQSEVAIDSLENLLWEKIEKAIGAL